MRYWKTALRPAGYTQAEKNNMVVTRIIQYTLVETYKMRYDTGD